jgi:hypothetical protein
MTNKPRILPRPKPYNPLAKKNLGASVAEALLEQGVQPLGQLSPFLGAGIYAIYYTGGFRPYRPIAERNRSDKFGWPIYVGKAVPPGARKALASNEETQALFGRLTEHKESIELARNLDIRDFFARYLVVDDIWIPLGESLLIAASSPLWNRHLDGFGNHDPGRGRYSGMRPRWDVVHPGRVWAEKCAQRPEPEAVIISEIENYLRGAPVPPERMRLLGQSPARLMEADIRSDERDDDEND